MKKMPLIGAALLTFAVHLPVAADQASVDQGKALHDAHCQACHGSEVYTRDDRKVKSLAGLDTQVNRCTHTLGIQWFEDESGAVVDYLNTTYYKF